MKHFFPIDPKETITIDIYNNLFICREGDLRVIRPFVYVREKHLRQFAEEKKLPVIAENCPACFEAPKVKG